MEKTLRNLPKKRGLSSSNHYKFKRSRKGYYWFKTDNGLTYRVFFTISQYAGFFHLDVESDVVSFVFNLKEKVEKIPHDRKVGCTIVHVLEAFFKKNPSQIISYICDDADDRAHKRQRNFQKWFESNNMKESLVLISASLYDVIHTGALMTKTNPDREKIENFLREELDTMKEAPVKDGEVLVFS